MIPSPIHRVLSTMRAHSVRHLLMGGQACILYGAAEFSRDADLAVVLDHDNLVRLQSALDALDATVTAVPPFEPRYLERGHAVHFQCAAEAVRGIRVDIMSRMRGVDPFPALWERRTVIEVPEGDAGILHIDVMALPDLVAAKKTQRDKDWPMIRRLVEANYFEFREQPTPERIAFWFRELRTPTLLIEIVATFPSEAASFTSRAVVAAARQGNIRQIEEALEQEQRSERDADRAYWAPLRKELEQLQHTRQR